MSIKENPFKKVYAKLFQILEDSVELGALVRPNNMVNLLEDKHKSGVKLAVQPGDMPEIILVSNGILEGSLVNTSTSTQMVRQYAYLVSTLDMRLNQHLYPVEWGLMCGLANYRELLLPLTYKGDTFVTHVDIDSADEGQISNNRNRGIQGWSASVMVSVTMHFNTANMIADSKDVGIT